MQAYGTYVFKSEQASDFNSASEPTVGEIVESEN